MTHVATAEAVGVTGLDVAMTREAVTTGTPSSRGGADGAESSEIIILLPSLVKVVWWMGGNDGVCSVWLSLVALSWCYMWCCSYSLFRLQ